MSVDAGMKPGKRNSFSTIQIWLPVGGVHYLVDQWRKQCEFEELRREVLRDFRRYRPIAILIERAANGHALISMMKGKHENLIHEIIPKGSKTSRLRGHIDTILARRILLPRNAAWRDEFVAECVKFPHGEFTDQIDAMTQYLDFMQSQTDLTLPPPPCLGVAVNSRGAIPPAFGGRFFVR